MLDDANSQAVLLFKQRCDAVDAHTQSVCDAAAKHAIAAINRGDRDECKRLTTMSGSLPAAAHLTKLEIGLKMSDELGLDGDDIEAMIFSFNSSKRG